jgi:GDSL-like lipase/acylhydrolase family protein
MTTTRKQLRAGALAAAVALAGVIAACGKDSVDIVAAPNAVNPIFQSYVALGNSLTAGWQSGGINDSTQRQSYARLVALQMGTRYAYASLAGPGCPPPVNNFLLQTRVGGGTGTPCFLRNPASATRVLNNVAVPDATVLDPTASTTTASNFLTQLVLGGKTQVQKALDAQPTFVSVWIGNNDVLGAAGRGVTVATPALGTLGITDTTTFKARYKLIVDGLKTQPNVKGILIGVGNVTAIPVLFPAESLFTNPTLKAQFDAAAGGTVTLVPNCTGSRALVSAGVLGQMRAGFPRVISCQANVPQAPLGDYFILDTLEQAIFNKSITAYNRYIAAKADSAGFAYFDPNPILAALRAGGQVPAFPDFSSATAPYGTYFTLDGVHFSNLTHILVAKGLITAINTKYSTSIPNLP